MKPILCRNALLFCCVALLAGAASCERRQISLNDGWQFRQHVEQASSDVPMKAAEWLPAEVPGDVHLDLLRAKLISDPFYRDNEAKLQWIENASWDYRRTLQVTPEMLSHQHVEIVFEGLDSACDVLVNGRKVMHPDNAFLEWRADLKPELHAGDNEILIAFPSPITAAAAVAARDPWQGRTGTDEKTYIRKPAYEYGWDWGPRFVTSGIWRPVHLEVWDEARISNLYVHQRDVSATVAHVDLQTEITATSAGSENLTVTYGHDGHTETISTAVLVHPGVNMVDVPLEIASPALWWPAGYGAQTIYQFHAQLNEGKKRLDASDTKAGLRSIVLRRDVDQWGRSFEFDVNGVPIYAKGADVIPFDSFPSRVTLAQYKQVLESAKAANMNMIRHWGGGYYETDEFFDLCDQLGIMVWQDFMFGNDWQPGTYDFKLGVEKEIEYQLRRLRNHPSIVIWAGNNETEAAFHWGGRDQLPSDVRMRMWQDYLTLFSGVIARTVARMDPETPYWPSSPSADYEDTTPSYQSGDMHDWSVWHGNASLEEYEKHFPRFMTEYGFQSFPEMRTIEAFTTPEDRTSIFTPVMLAHQKNAAGNSIIDDYMRRYYGEPKDFASFLYASQVLQAESIKIGAEHLRRIRPRNMGSIFWQLNDCWPVASWSSIDYYGRWKALQYYARRFYAPVLVSPHVENGSLAVYAISDKTEPTAATLRLRVMDFHGKVLIEKSQPVTIPPLSSKVFLEIPLGEFLNANGTDAGSIFAAADLAVNGEPISKNLIYFVSTKVVHLPEASISTEITAAGPGKYRMRLTSPVLARSVYVSFGDEDASVSDNYFDLLPNEPVEVTVESRDSLETLKSALKTVSLVDAFAPAAVATK